MRITHLHPGVSLERVQVKTGFDLDISPQLSTTEPPTKEEVDLLREVVDPLGIRRLELLSGPKRRRLLRAALEQEIAHSHNGS